MPIPKPTPPPLSDPIDRIVLLTEAERIVLWLLGQGYGREAIATYLSRSKKTVDAHRHELITKLGFSKELSGDSCSNVVAKLISFGARYAERLLEDDVNRKQGKPFVAPVKS